ncbi:MAG: hypothetical protein WEC59_10190 [Salibacteraceae bacterium]
MKTIEILHIATQYLTTAAKSFVPAKHDDSHTNLGWDQNDKQLFTHPFDKEGLQLAFDHINYSIDLLHPSSGIEASYPLQGARHLDVINWIDREARFCKLPNTYAFELHFELPYKTAFKDTFIFPELNRAEVNEIIALRDIADRSLTAIAAIHEHAEPVRTWPHHFDTATLIDLEGNGKRTIGCGLAVPDGMIDDFYFYVSGYLGDESVALDESKTLSHGSWKSGEWNGGVLSGEDARDFNKVLAFLTEASGTTQSRLRKM